jgi:hypothetical protein
VIASSLDGDGMTVSSATEERQSAQGQKFAKCGERERESVGPKILGLGT